MLEKKPSKIFTKRVVRNMIIAGAVGVAAGIIISIQRDIKDLTIAADAHGQVLGMILDNVEFAPK